MHTLTQFMKRAKLVRITKDDFSALMSVAMYRGFVRHSLIKCRLNTLCWKENLEKKTRFHITVIIRDVKYVNRTDANGSRTDCTFIDWICFFFKHIKSSFVRLFILLIFLHQNGICLVKVCVCIPVNGNWSCNRDFFSSFSLHRCIVGGHALEWGAIPYIKSHLRIHYSDDGMARVSLQIHSLFHFSSIEF